jgi:hypothetical protein
MPSIPEHSDWQEAQTSTCQLGQFTSGWGWNYLKGCPPNLIKKKKINRYENMIHLIKEKNVLNL